MSLRIIKAGILDTIQDRGLKGLRHLGIPPAGVMDRWSAGIASVLVGNRVTDPVIEIHFPASEYFFEKAALICIAGADFSAHINGEEIPIAQPVLINRFSILQFYGVKKGMRAYLAVRGGFDIPKWGNSYSTNIKAGLGGLRRVLKKDDEIPFRALHTNLQAKLGRIEFEVLPWKGDNCADVFNDNKILLIEGGEWDHLSGDAKGRLPDSTFTVMNKSDRMGYFLKGPELSSVSSVEMVSSAVSFGTIQLLPSGQLIVLMADHQTTGGYPRIANVISAHLPVLAQKKPGEQVSFAFTGLDRAADLLFKQELHLQQLANASTLRLEKYLHEN